MSKVLQFYGASDDLFVEEATNSEMCDCAQGRTMAYRVQAPDGSGLYVVGQYGLKDHMVGAEGGGGGCWMVGIQQLAEDHPLPAWPMAFAMHERGYSVELKLTAPDDAVVEYTREEGAPR